ncbi:MAG: hypothetical protein IPL40_01340 [Proteobacteria bacterium]|nr:hypothetical protein [Pseudomonadota bacterium]
MKVRERQPPSSSRAPAAARRARPLRVLLALFFCAGIAGLGLLSGGEPPLADAVLGRDPLAGYYPPEMPRYPQVQEVPTGARGEVEGARLRMSYFQTTDEPDRVADFYARFWRARGLWVRSDVTHRGGTVAAVDGAHGRVLQVMISTGAGGAGATLVMPSVGDAPGRERSGSPRALPIALFPRSEQVLDSTTDGRDALARTVLSLNAGTLEENVAHYRRALRQAGYTEDVARPGAEQRAALQALDAQTAMLVFRHAEGREATVTITVLEPQRTRVHLALIGAP